MGPDNASAVKFAGIKVPPDLGKRHFFFLFLCTFITGTFMAIPAVIQPAFLKDVILVSPDFLGSTGSFLQQTSQLAMLFLAALVGSLSDRTGRKLLACVGFAVIAISFFVMGQSNEIAATLDLSSGTAATLCAVFSFVPSQAEAFVPFAPGLAVAYLSRFLIGIGIAFAYPQFITMVADYTAKDDRGKGMGFNGLMLGLAGLASFIVFPALQKSNGLEILFHIASGLGVAGFLSAIIFLKDRMPEQTAKKARFREVMGIVRKRLPLKASYLCALITRADTPVLTTFLALWAVKVAEDSGLTSAQATQKVFIPLMIMGVASIAAFPIIGILLDKWGRIKTILLSLALITGAFVLIVLMPSPFSPILYGAVILAAIGMSGTVAGTNTWVTDAAPKAEVGTVLGGLNTMQPLGCLIFLAIGGVLFDKFGPAGAFAVKGGADLALILWILAIRKKVEADSAEAE